MGTATGYSPKRRGTSPLAGQQGSHVPAGREAFLPVIQVKPASLREWGVIRVSEDPQPGAARDMPAGPHLGQDVRLAEGTRLTDIVVGRIADQARRTAKAARSGRVANAGGEPGVLDLTPLRELLPEVVEELRKVRPRERIARALQPAADIIDPQTPIH
jgi:hypothetical protein